MRKTTICEPTLSTSILALTMNAAGPKVSEYLSPWYPSLGSVNPGNRPLAAQSNLPPSTMTPAIVVPCPPIHLVALWTTMSAPWAMGWMR